MRQKRGRWTTFEDEQLKNCVRSQLSKNKNNDSTFDTSGVVPKGFSWKAIEQKMKSRNSKQCRERWINHLSPSIIKVDWTEEEDESLLRHFSKTPNKWVEIAKQMPGRSQNQVKMRWRALRRRRKTANKKRKLVKIVSNSDEESRSVLKQEDLFKMEDLVKQEEMSLFLNHSSILTTDDDIFKTLNLK